MCYQRLKGVSKLLLVQMPSIQGFLPPCPVSSVELLEPGAKRRAY